MRRKYQSNPRVSTNLSMAFWVLLGFAMNGSAATHYVSQTSLNPTVPYSTPNTAAHNIQDAVDASSDGDTVLVAAGQYLLTNQVTVTKAIVLEGVSGPSQTYLIAQSSIWCLWVSNSLATIDGFAMQPFALGNPMNATGLFLADGVARSCTFTNFFLTRLGSSVAMSGGVLSNSIITYRRSPAADVSAIYCADGGIINDCEVIGREGGPNGIGVYLVSSVLENSFISGAPAAGVARGSAVHAFASTIAGCTITNNFTTGRGGGAFLDGCFMDRCLVAGNACRGGIPGTGGGGIFATNSIIRSSLIVSNNANVAGPEPPVGGLGGGVYMQGGALVNCTVTMNTAVDYPSGAAAGGGVYTESGGVTNSIIYFNSSYGAHSGINNWFDAGASIFDRCCTTPDPGGVGNVTQDPEFIEPGNFHLRPASPCIDAGIVQAWMAGAFDLDGNPRIRGASVDIGAYESPSVTPHALVELLIADVNALISQGDLSPAAGNALHASLQAALNSLNRGITRAACGQVGAFVNKAEQFIRKGKLSEGDGQSLISAAEDLRIALGCGSR